MRGGSIASFEVSVHDDVYDATNSPSCGLRKRASLQSSLRSPLRVLVCQVKPGQASTMGGLVMFMRHVMALQPS